MALQVGCTIKLSHAHSLCLTSNTSSHHHAGATADAFTLYDRLETQLEQHSGKEKLGFICNVGCLKCVNLVLKLVY